jgi:CRP/FNR family transcriptional regulator, cyclic AMP receptor protein
VRQITLQMLWVGQGRSWIVSPLLTLEDGTGGGQRACHFGTRASFIAGTSHVAVLNYTITDMADQSDGSMMDLLAEGQRAALEDLGTHVQYPSAEVIFREGQPSYSVLIIHEGHIKVTRRAADGAEVTLAIRGPGYIMGDEGVLMDEVRSATVTTMTDVTGLDIKADALLEFVDTHQLWPVMYRAAVLRRRQSEEEIILTRPDTVRTRLARWLLQLVAEVGEQVDDGWQIAPSQQELAGRIGASRDAVAAELGKLRKEELVTTSRQRIVLRDLEAIRKIALHNL